MLDLLNKVHLTDVLEGMKKLPENSVDCIITSPPYWLLRNYGWEGQWGMESTFIEYLQNLWQLIDEAWRVLKPHGTVWINIGDTYIGGGSGNSGEAFSNNNDRQHIENVKNRRNFFEQNNIKSKSLVLIPHRFAIGCIERGWIVRNDIIWAKPNSMPESVKDRFTKKHEYFFFMVKSNKTTCYYNESEKQWLFNKPDNLAGWQPRDYYFDIDGIREKLLNPVGIRNKASERYGNNSGDGQFSKGERAWGDSDKGKNPGGVQPFWENYKKPSFEEYMQNCADYYNTTDDFWNITLKPTNKDHYAAYNDDLINKPIIAGSPVKGIVLDPFAGTGTTLIRAYELGRQVIGFEGKPEYVELANKNLSKFTSQLKLW